ncbi:YdeI/OmpD-associated family protein [Cohnella terricola]|uniref:YdeI/OmpD-associated family protein n=1 Tax=Cohnella terricola TaxID=1289167 RepID=A0A559JW86_9BACL|nr:YdeI/OmpD-associated family protein [Cohnella terricola]TVY04097.1 YdeI/OmpD-associated family protein [Cohnella terricola]
MDEALIKKLRVPPAGKIAVIEAPEGFLARIGQEEEKLYAFGSESGSCDYVQLFAENVAELEKYVPEALRAVNRDGMLWICYPKGTSKIKTDLNRDKGWACVNKAGWEGIALVSIDDTWSAMRFRPVEAVGKSRPSPEERRSSRTESAEPPEVPEDLRAALQENEAAESFFAKLAPSHKKEYIRWVLDAKRQETRDSRVRQTIEKLRGGLKRPSDK